MKHLLVEYKGSKCVECGYDKCEGSLQFHHVNTENKDFSFGDIHPHQMSLKELKTEVDKCVLLCANCHIKKHIIEDVVGFVMNLNNDRDINGKTRNCQVCYSPFIVDYAQRVYCPSCVPRDLDDKGAKRARLRAVKRELLKYKGTGCVSCGYDECAGVLQLHHRDPNEKEFTFSKITLNTRGVTMEALKKEADKCDVLCANCHFEVHYKNDDDGECA